MAVRVKIVGAGSIGNHLSHACREQGYDVTLCDRDADALRRTREDIYPSRYGAWDEAITLASADALQAESFDLVIVGTPPDTHMPIALAQLRQAPPKVLFIEKPLSPPDLAGCAELQRSADERGTFVGVGFNHTLTRNTIIATEWLRENRIGDVITIRSMTREHWGGIFGAHPWLAGPKDSYLGFTERGGGAIGEHCHAINIWQHFALALGQGRIREVSAMLDWVEEDGARYDRLAQLNVKTEAGLVGTIVQDVVTEPAKKWLRVQGSEGYLEWEVNADQRHDEVITCVNGERSETRIPKTRPDDFRGEIEHIGALLEGRVKDSPVSLERGLETMLVVAAAIRSSEEGRSVTIDYTRGPSLSALDSGREA
ncbi:MAG: Gfo/Idh/MocA family oxidoreductase [Myxococcota bacterium]|nr:Gfo/Idh/MocA family oxidoreductase [Myxococcota bacterium]